MRNHDQGIFCEITGDRQKTCDKKRKLINDYLRKKFRQSYVTFPDILFPRHYDRDGEHINEKMIIYQGKTTTSEMKKFQCRLARVLCRH